MLLSRDVFRESVFQRDNHKCVICGNPAKDAHHIIERRLFEDGGYYIDNGASLCEEHHMMAERTILTCEEIREAADIKNIILPGHMYTDVRYDKWGNVYLQNGSRLMGELFYDESVQKILQPILHEFTPYVKYPRTYHLPWSQNITDDDRVIKTLEQFEGREIVITEKMDGENSTFYSDLYFHARSLDSESHPSQSWVRNFSNKVAWELPEGWRVCGENLYATHSIEYNELQSYFYGFSIWNNKNECISWDETKDIFDILGITSVPVLYRGNFDIDLVKDFHKTMNLDVQEGYVMRIVDKFSFIDFKKYVTKFVRAQHVKPNNFHWKYERYFNVNKIKE